MPTPETPRFSIRTSGSVLLAGVITALCLAQPVPAESKTRPAKIIRAQGPFVSSTPQYEFAETLAEQEAQLATNPLIRRFAESRKAMASDPYRPAYHFVSPESALNDPNGLTFWQGRWHLFYQAYPPDEFPDPKGIDKFPTHWGHAVSDDLVHWRDLPYAIYPGLEKAVYSGGTLVEKDRVIAFYPGMYMASGQRTRAGNAASMMVATSTDPLLLNWKKSAPLEIPLPSDSDIWKQGDTYYAAINGAEDYYPDASVKADPNRYAPEFVQKFYGGLGVWPRWNLWTSKDLKAWNPQGDLLFEKTPFTDRFDDAACPNFQKIGDKYIMLFFSHMNGGQYLLGDYDEDKAKFRPYDHGRFNHGQVGPGGVHAPSAMTDKNGDVIAIFNINAAKPTVGWDQIMSLPQRLSLDADKRLKIEPIETVASLRGERRQLGKTALPANEELVLEGMRGNTIELDLEIDPQNAHQVQLNVLRSPDAQERTAITFFNAGKQEIVLDGSESSILSDVAPRPPERADLNKARGDPLKLRVFIDRSVVEVFANGKQYMAMRIYPGRKDSLGLSLKARGGDAVLKSLDVWQMKSIWP